MFSWDLPSLRFRPVRYRFGGVSNWSGHTPFACDLVDSLRPSIFVELGVNGESYFPICQTIAERSISSAAYAVDTWHADFDTGQCGTNVFAELDSYNQSHYWAFSRLFRTTFDDASSRFERDGIGLLHINGLYTYEAITHHFETWFPKIRPGGVVLLHGTALHGSGSGMRQFWRERCRVYTAFELTDGWGTGVLLKPGPLPATGIVGSIFRSDPGMAESIRRYYELCATPLNGEGGAESPCGPCEFDIQVFWRDPGQEFCDTRSAKICQRVGAREDIVLRLPVGPCLSAKCEVRVDLAGFPILLQLKSASLVTPEGDIAWALEPDCLPSKVRYTGVQSIRSGGRTGIVMNMTGTEASLLFVIARASGPALSCGDIFEVVLCGLDPHAVLAEVASGLEICHGEIERLRRLLVTREIELFESSRSLQHAQKLLPQQAERINAAGGTVKVSADALKAAELIVQQRDKQLQTYDARMAERDCEIRKLQAELHISQAALKRAHKLAAEQECRHKNLLRRLNDIESSLLWRVSSPLRKFGRAADQFNAGGRIDERN